MKQPCAGAALRSSPNPVVMITDAPNFPAGPCAARLAKATWVCSKSGVRIREPTWHNRLAMQSQPPAAFYPRTCRQRQVRPTKPSTP